MTRAISRILLSLLSFPLASLLYLVMFIFFERANSNGEFISFMYSGVVTWAFLAAFWYWLWRAAVLWTPRRWAATAFAAGGALAAGAVIGVVTSASQRDVGFFVASALAPLLWLSMICVIWRETDEEQARRLSRKGADGVVCLRCQYSLTGLTTAKCPECGTSFTLEELFAGQPTRAASAID
jgi:hypothetical protein